MNSALSWSDVMQWASLVRHLPVSVIATDETGVVRLWTEGATALFGWSPEEAVGQSITSLTVGPTEQGIAEEIMGKVMAFNVWEGEFTAQRRNGESVDIHVIDAPILDDDGDLAGIVGVSVDVSLSRSDLQRTLHEVRNYADVTAAALDADRARITQELHDDLGQTLTAMRSELLWLRDLPVEQHGEVLARVDELLARGIDSIHRICDDLRPRLLDEVGICAALDLMAVDFQRRSGAQCRVHLDEDRIGWLSSKAEDAAYRVVQEALTNVERHAAGVTSVLVELTADESSPVGGRGFRDLLVRVTNDGLAYDGSRGFGIVGMQERARALGGRTSIQANLRSGSVLELRLPSDVAYTDWPAIS